MKKLCLDPCDFQIDDSQLIDFDSVDKDQQEAELLRLRNEIELLKEKTEKQNNFFKHILSTDKTCKHYTGFPNIAMLEAVYNFMDPGEDGENIVLSNSKNAKENEARGRKRLLRPMESFILTLVRLRRNFDVKHLMYLFTTSEGTVVNSITTWINFMYIY